MGQRVNIQYSVDIDDLQDEINRLFSNAISDLNNVLPVGGKPVVKLGTDGLEKIDFIRQRLTRVDTMLGDVQNIVEGYVRFKTQPPPPQVSLPIDEAESLEMEQLEDRIAKFKEMFDAQPNQESEEEHE